MALPSEGGFSLSGLLVALVGGGVVLTDPLAAFYPNILPPMLEAPIEASLGVGGALLLLDWLNAASLEPFSKKEKQRMLLSVFIGTFSASFLDPFFLGNQTEAIAATLSVLVTQYLPNKYHVIQ
jgi:hypothetical protein